MALYIYFFETSTESLEMLLLLSSMFVSCRFLLSGSYEDNRARRREFGRCSAPAAEPVVQRQASGACKRGPQHAVGARGHSKTGQALIAPSFQNTEKTIFVILIPPSSILKGTKSLEPSTKENPTERRGSIEQARERLGSS